MCVVNINQELNGIEISFESKPDSAVLDAIKSNGFRWNRPKKIWYAKQTAERLEFAQTLGTVAEVTPVAVSSSEIIYNLNNLGENRPEYLGGAELSKAIREELKKRGVRGCTVKVCHYDHIYITWKAAADDFASLEEAAERCNIWDLFRYRYCYHNGYHLSEDDYCKMSAEDKESVFYENISRSIESFNNVYAGTLREPRNQRNYYHELSAKGFKTLSAIIAIGNQWNYDNSDSMTDYFDVGYILDIDIKKPDGFETRATMTDAERKAYEEEKAAEEAAELEAQKEYEERQKAAREAEKKYNAFVSESEEIIFNDIQVFDLEESERIYITNIIGGIGKENNLDELKKETAENPHFTDALITRKVVFNSADALERFNKLYLHDFAFVAGKGGTATDDTRLKNWDEFSKLNEDQRDSIKWYANDCIAVYLDDKLQLIVNPEGFGYSRYVYLTTDTSEILNASKKCEELRNESEGLNPFYFPEAATKQAENIKIGDDVTIFQCDGWILNNVQAGAGQVVEVTAGDYAQYKGIYITLQTGRKQKRVFIKDHGMTLIYKGIKNVLPEEVTSKRISDKMRQLYNYDVLIPNIYNYFLNQNITPILDTWQR